MGFFSDFLSRPSKKDISRWEENDRENERNRIEAEKRGLPHIGIVYCDDTRKDSEKLFYVEDESKRVRIQELKPRNHIRRIK